MKSYEEKQAEWVVKNDLKVGDKVRIVKVPSIKEIVDWGDEWLREMDYTINKEYILEDDFFEYSGGVQVKGFYYPYFVLEKVEASNTELVKRIDEIEAELETISSIQEAIETTTQDLVTIEKANQEELIDNLKDPINAFLITSGYTLIKDGYYLNLDTGFLFKLTIEPAKLVVDE